MSVEQAPLAADAIYFLMWPGWNSELRSNRWHYARRWARLVPVVLVQPIQTTAGWWLTTRREPRIDNCRVLRVRASADAQSSLNDTLIQLGQLATDSKRHGLKRPLLWCYNPWLVGLYAAFPAVGRVFHATENYFHFQGLTRFFLESQRVGVGVSDLTVAVSEGVGRSLREHVPGARIEVVTNGCDYKEYSHGSPDRRLMDSRASWERVAVYAGNINARLDFSLLRGCARENSKTLFAFFGPVAGLSDDDAVQWRQLLREPNVAYFGPVSPERLPGVYHAADLGLIPYKHSRYLVENGYPLKALEMCATGLPVVSTLMRPIEGLLEGLTVVRDNEGFRRCVSRVSRSTLTEAQRDEMHRICERHDYDRKFAQILSMLEEVAPAHPAPTTRLDAVVSRLWTRQWLGLARQRWRRSVSWCPRPAGIFAESVALERVFKGILAIATALRDSQRRHLLFAWLRCRLRGVKIEPRALAEDLLRLHILRREMTCAPVDGEGFSVRIGCEPSGERIRIESFELRSVQASQDSRDWPADSGGLREITWDHSRVGTGLRCRFGPRTMVVSMGPDGTHEFRALAVIARYAPGTVWKVFSQLSDRLATTRE